ncbi:PREDICTED: mucin-2-like [Papilio polytes]|uniref:mucin-2-like n=1 Tax=Papilio polytes TaxID=76194 RepID=UPI0006766CD3|nr:PREDICTED: mucin-2-like [Papilio polytes]
MWLLFLCVVAGAALHAEGAGAGAARLVCYVESTHASEFSECTHLVYAGDARGEKLDNLLREYRKSNPRLKIILRVSEVDKDLRPLLKSKHVQGLEIHDAHRTLNRTKVTELVESARSAISTTGGGPLFLALPAHPELLAKYYDLRELVKKTDLMIIQTHALGLVKKMTYHPSRLSGLWDMMNTDSVVDLVVGLGVPSSKVVISLPATARQFTLLNETLSTPGSPTLDDEPKEIDQAELCRQLQKGRWTLERDQDLSAPYAFKNTTWISFEDASSVDVKGKYARVRGLAGLALHKADKDVDTPCGPTLRASLTKVLNQQSRAPRAAVLRSLENEILSAGQGRPLDALQVSPYRITQIVDSDGVIHSIREDTRTEFSCSRQGYFVHPRSCARFYRCVKFDQYSADYTVFEFDCPTGLAFDARYEVCVWPGSLAHSQACPGTAEIAPVPRTRFICPDAEGYYADPENCRWFFACLDHGKAPLTAYEFRCPFGLGFDAARLKCDWPWLVPGCGNIARYEAEAYGFSAATLTGALGFQGKTADAVNIAAHQSLASGAALDNLVGLQGGFLTNGDAIDTNFITSQELEGGASNGHEYILTNDASSLVENVIKYNGEQANLGLVQATKYNDGPEYTSGSIILDDYRLPSQKTGASQARLQNVGATASYAQSTGVTSSVRKNTGKYDARYNTGYYKPQQLSGARFSDGKYRPSNTGKYVHDPTGDRALPYNHVASPIVPYKHVDYGYTVTKGFDVGKYNGSWSYTDSGDKASDGYYYNKPTGPAFEEGGYNTGYTGTYNINGYVGTTDDSGAYDHSSAGHTLTAGAVNVGLVGKTTLVDVGYTGDDYENVKTGQVSYVSQPGVTINHVGTDLHNLDGYSFATNPTSSGIPTTATPFAVTTALPTVTTFKTTYVPLAPKTSIKQIFTVTPAPVTFVTPKVEVTDYNLNTNYQSEIKASTGYDYAKPRIPFEEGISYTTAAPGIAVSTYKPQGFSHQQQTIHHVAADISSYSTPVTEVPFKKLVAYTTTGPTISSYSQTHGQQTNRFGSTNVFSTETGSTGYNQGESTVTFVQPQNVVQYTQTLPTASILPTVSTYQPQTFSQQTLHKVDASRINAFVQNGEASYQYTKPTGYDGSRQTVIQFTTPTPIVTSTYRPQAFSQQTLHRVVSSTVRPVVRKQYTYQTTPVTLYENPILKYTQKVFPQTIVSSTYAPQTYSQQTIQTGETAKTFGIDGGYTYTKSGVTYQQPQKVVEVSTIRPAIAVQPVVSTYQPQSYNQQTIHKVDAAQINTYTQGAGVSGYFNTQPIVTLEDTAKTVVESSTAVPVVTSTYRPYTVRQRIQTQKLIPVSTTPLPKVELTYQPSVTIYENPILKYTQKVTPVTYVQPTATVFTQTIKPVQQYQTTGQTYNNLNVDVKQAGYTYSQPEIQTNIGSSKAYSDASVVSRQEFHLNTGNQYSSGKDVVFVSTTPSTLVYEDHYSTKDNTQSTAYIAPETKYQRTYTRPTVSVPVVNEQISTIYKTQDQYDYKPLEFSQQYDISQTVPAQVSVSQTTVELPRKTIFKQTAYQAPEIQVAYKGEDYLPPVVTTVTPIVTSTYQPSTYSTVGTSREYLPAVSKTTFEYNGPEYLPPQTTAKPTTKSREYLPPVAQTVFESKITNTPYQDYSVPQDTTVVSSTATPTYRKQNIVVETAKSQLLGFGSVGTDAGLVTPVTYSTAAPVVVSSTENYYVQPKVVTSTYAPELVEVTSSAPRRSRPKYFRPSVTSTTQAPTYEDAKSTTAYRGPDYLPPSENINQKLETIGLTNADVSYSQNLNVNPYQEYTISDATPVVISSTAAPLRKQNIVVDTAKSNLLGFGTVGPDAGLVTYTSSPAPSVGTYQTVSSTYAPIQEELVDVTPSLIPVRRTKPKVAVVTKINDFNPLLVRKLGAVCSCQSPVLVLKGRRPAVKQQEVYTNDYDTVTQSSRVQTPVVTTVVTPTPAVTSTYNPIIVPDDSFYQDYQDQASNDHIAIVPNGNDHGNYVSSTPAIISTTEKVVRIRPRVKTVTVAPTYRTVLLNEDVSPTVEIKGAEVTTDSQSFDRYGPGGWRGRDETLQGSVDCQRAGLFRHPKQCNKFYACRWDCTKQRFTLHVFNCPVQLSFDPNLGACNWPSQGPACQGDTLLTNTI